MLTLSIDLVSFELKVNILYFVIYPFFLQILTTTTARRMAVIDVEKGDQISSYDNCAFNGRDRAGLAVDPTNPNMAVCCCVNGKVQYNISTILSTLLFTLQYSLINITILSYLHYNYTLLGDP